MLEGFDKQAATFAADVDRAFWITIGITGVVTVLITAVMIYFVFRYHHSRSRPEETSNIRDHMGLEVAWTVIPTARHAF